MEKEDPRSSVETSQMSGIKHFRAADSYNIRNNFSKDLSSNMNDNNNLKCHLNLFSEKFSTTVNRKNFAL